MSLSLLSAAFFAGLLRPDAPRDTRVSQGTASVYANAALDGTKAPDRTLHLKIGNNSIAEADLGVLMKGIFAVGRSVETVNKKAGTLPPGYLYVYYAGRDEASHRERIWLVMPDFKDDSATARVNDEYLAAYALAALDADGVAEPWRSLYRQTVKDEPSRSSFGRDIARIFDEASDQKEKMATTDVNWIRQHIVVGESRNDAYAALRSYGLVAFNSDYAPGIPIGNNGCDFSSHPERGYWPYHGEPLPKRTGGCALPFFTKAHADEFPPAYLTLYGAFNIACGSRVDVALEFDRADRIEAVKTSKPEWTCV